MMFLSELLSLHWQADTNPRNEQGDEKKYSCSGGQWWLISALAAAVSTWSTHWSWHSTSIPRLWTTSYQIQDTYLRDTSTVSASQRREGYCASSGSASPKSSCVLLQNLLLSPPTCPSLAELTVQNQRWRKEIILTQEGNKYRGKNPTMAPHPRKAHIKSDFTSPESGGLVQSVQTSQLITQLLHLTCIGLTRLTQILSLGSSV